MKLLKIIFLDLIRANACYYSTNNIENCLHFFSFYHCEVYRKFKILFSQFICVAKNRRDVRLPHNQWESLAGSYESSDRHSLSVVISWILVTNVFNWSAAEYNFHSPAKSPRLLFRFRYGHFIYKPHLYNSFSFFFFLFRLLQRYFPFQTQKESFRFIHRLYSVLHDFFSSSLFTKLLANSY